MQLFLAFYLGGSVGIMGIMLTFEGERFSLRDALVEGLVWPLELLAGTITNYQDWRRSNGL